jgi:hypothetical protein
MLKKQDLIKIIRKRLKNNFNEDQINQVIEVLDELIEDEQPKRFDIVRYVEKLFETRYNDIYIDNVSPKLQIEINKFKNYNNIIDSKYKEFGEWLVERCETVLNRKTVPYDLYNQKLYDKFINDYKEEKVIINEKKILQKKKILSI